jgi:hypothetical protein
MLKNYPKLPATNQKLSISRSTENQPWSRITSIHLQLPKQFHSPSHHVCMLICALNSGRLTVHNNKKSMKTLKQKQVLASCVVRREIFLRFRLISAQKTKQNSRTLVECIGNGEAKKKFRWPTKRKIECWWLKGEIKLKSRNLPRESSITMHADAS